jgi:hypothetical protein
VTLVAAEFEKGQKKAARNVEVVMTVHLRSGEQLQNCIVLGAGDQSVSVSE